MPRVRFGIDIAQQRLEWDELVGRARLGEELGFDGAWGFDHFSPLYGEGPGNCFEGMTTLAAIATATSRIRLGLLVTGVTYRHRSVLAAEAITIDHASGGRLELALGAAWFENEHRELEAHQRAGTAYLVCGWPGEGHRRVEEFATRFLTPAA